MAKNKPHGNAGLIASPVVPWSLLAIAALAVFAFSPALRAPLIFDDLRAVEYNPTIHSLSESLDPPQGTAVAGRPIPNLTLAIDYRLNAVLGIDQSPGSADPNRTVVYHLTNLLIHLLAGLLLFGIVRRTMRSPAVLPAFAQRWSALPLIVTAIWWVHPLQSEAVDYVVQRTESLASLWYLATLYCSVRAWDAVLSKQRTVPWYVAAVGACALGMASKEIMVTAPLVVLLYDRAYRMTAWRDLGLPANRARLWFYGSLVATLTIQAVLLIGTPRSGTVGFGLGMTWSQYLITQGWAIPHYLISVFAPIGLSLDYGASAVPAARGIPGIALLGLLAVMTVWEWRRGGRRLTVAFLGVAFFLLLAPSSSIVPITSEVAADRRMYLALAPVLVAICVGIDALFARLRTGNNNTGGTLAGNVRVGALVIAAVFALLSFRRSELYADPAAIWSDARDKYPDNARAWLNSGVLAAAATPPRLVQADSFYSGAVARDSSYSEAVIRLTISRLNAHRYAEARSLVHNLGIDGENAVVLRGMAETRFGQADTSGAIVVLERLADDSSAVQPMIDLIGIDESAGRDSAEATVLRRANRLFPKRPDVLFHLGTTLLRLNQPDSAELYLEQVSQLVTESAPVLTALARAKAALGKKQEAAELFAKALKLDPSDSTARRGRDYGKPR